MVLLQNPDVLFTCLDLYVRIYFLTLIPIVLSALICIKCFVNDGMPSIKSRNRIHIFPDNWIIIIVNEIASSGIPYPLYSAKEGFRFFVS